MFSWISLGDISGGISSNAWNFLKRFPGKKTHLLRNYEFLIFLEEFLNELLKEPVEDFSRELTIGYMYKLLMKSIECFLDEYLKKFREESLKDFRKETSEIFLQKYILKIFKWYLDWRNLWSTFYKKPLKMWLKNTWRKPLRNLCKRKSMKEFAKQQLRKLAKFLEDILEIFMKEFLK